MGKALFAWQTGSGRWVKFCFCLVSGFATRLSVGSVEVGATANGCEDVSGRAMARAVATARSASVCRDAQTEERVATHRKKFVIK